jgi:hypothetical protein
MCLTSLLQKLEAARNILVDNKPRDKKLNSCVQPVQPAVAQTMSLAVVTSLCRMCADATACA